MSMPIVLASAVCRTARPEDSRISISSAPPALGGGLAGHLAFFVSRNLARFQAGSIFHLSDFWIFGGRPPSFLDFPDLRLIQ